MSYEQLREQCKCNGNPHTLECLYQHFLSYTGYEHSESLFKAYSDGADSRALPLPEVKQEPTLFQYRAAPDWVKPDQWSEWRECTKESFTDYSSLPILNDWRYETRAFYVAPTDAEALRKENERLREENKALLDTISMGLASSIKCNCGHLEKYRAEAKKVVDTTLEGGAK